MCTPLVLSSSSLADGIHLSHMVIIGHRGAAGLKPENTLESFAAGVAAGADMLEFDVRLTKDNIPVVMHDSHLIRTHQKVATVRSLTFDDLVLKTKKSKHPALKLETVLQQFGGMIMFNIELKDKGLAEIIVPLIENNMKYIGDWESIVISSFHVRELKHVRTLSTDAQLALLQYMNPLKFVAFERQLRLSAVGFHRLHVNRLAVEIAKRLNIFTYVYTVNRPEAALRFEQLGIDGLVTDFPDRMSELQEEA